MPNKSTAQTEETAKRLKILRAECNLTQSRVADELGLSQQMYSKYESGATVLDADMVRKLCAFYGVSADYILGIEPVRQTGGQQVAFEIGGENEKLIDLIVEQTLLRIKNEKKQG